LKNVERLKVKAFSLFLFYRGVFGGIGEKINIMKGFFLALSIKLFLWKKVENKKK